MVKYEIGAGNEQIIEQRFGSDVPQSFLSGKTYGKEMLKTHKDFAKNDEVCPLFLRAISPFPYNVRTCHSRHRLRLAGF